MPLFLYGFFIHSNTIPYSPTSLEVSDFEALDRALDPDSFPTNAKLYYLFRLLITIFVQKIPSLSSRQTQKSKSPQWMPYCTTRFDSSLFLCRKCTTNIGPGHSCCFKCLSRYSRFTCFYCTCKLQMRSFCHLSLYLLRSVSRNCRVPSKKTI
jgi:hypothetical protein